MASTRKKTPEVPVTPEAPAPTTTALAPDAPTGLVVPAPPPPSAGAQDGAEPPPSTPRVEAFTTSTTPEATPEENDTVLRAEHEALLADLEAQLAQLQQENTDLQAQIQEANEVLAATRREHLALEEERVRKARPLGDERAEQGAQARSRTRLDTEQGAAAPPSEAPRLPPPGHVRIRVKRGNVVLSMGTRSAADGVFDVPAWEVEGMDNNVVEILALG
jgi:hypothetical protein